MKVSGLGRKVSWAGRACTSSRPLRSAFRSEAPALSNGYQYLHRHWGAFEDDPEKYCTQRNTLWQLVFTSKPYTWPLLPCCMTKRNSTTSLSLPFDCSVHGHVKKHDLKIPTLSFVVRGRNRYSARLRKTMHPLPCEEVLFLTTLRQVVEEAHRQSAQMQVHAHVFLENPMLPSRKQTPGTSTRERSKPLHTTGTKCDSSVIIRFKYIINPSTTFLS